MAKHKIQKETATILQAIDDSFSEIDMLRDEMEEWQGKMEGTNLESTNKYEQVTEAVDALSNFDRPDIPESLYKLLENNVQVEYSILVPYKGRGLSRASRLSNAVVALEAVVQKLEEISEGIEDDEKKSEAQGYLTDLNNAKDEVEFIDFPGMY